MKKIKVLIIFLLIIIVSGCSANYNIKISDGKVEENLTLIETDKSKLEKTDDSGLTLKEIMDSLLEEDEYVKSTSTTELIDEKDRYGIKYNNSYELNDIVSNTLISQCYNNPIVKIENNVLTIDSGTDFTCFDNYEEFESMEVTIDTDYEVLSNNASKTKGNKYTWKIERLNDTRIMMDISLEESNNSIILLIIIILFITVVGFVLYNNFKRKQEISNQI